MKKIRDYYIPENDYHFQEYLKQFEHYQEAQRNRALSYVENWGLAIDIGANIGLWSKDLSNYFDKLICFEPNPNCIDYLKKNIKIKNAEIYPYGLGAEECNQDLFIHPINSGASSFVDYTKVGLDKQSRPVYGKFPDQTQKINVNIKKLDNFNFEKIDFIKIDVQGYEYKVLKGAKKTLTNNNPIICLEEDKPQDSETIPYLKSLNYSIIDIINKEYIFKKKS
tara:strand:- start:2315 stop:2983 length:669 start_codon:yes stop_codon:yes gene_type:complete